MRRIVPVDSHRRHTVVFGYSDTGRGHRSAADAVAEALLTRSPHLDLRIIDLLTDYAPPPWNTMPRLYRRAAHSRLIWGASYALGNGRRRAQAFHALNARLARDATARFLTENPASLFVAFHPGIVGPLLRAVRTGPQHRAFATVVTDLTTMTALWFDPAADLCIVPTDRARIVARRMGVPAESIRVRGMPVGHRFHRTDAAAPASRRAALGWAPDRPAVLVMGGGDGVGPLREVTAALTRLDAGITVAVVAGRNDRLHRELLTHRWPASVHVYGFVDDVHPLLAAADIVVTKAGPSAMFEAFAMGLPVVLCHRITGQEEGNVAFAVSAGAAVWAARPNDVATAVAWWLADPAVYDRVAANSRRLGLGSAAQAIADDLLGLLPV